MPAPNPFIYGSPVTASRFVGREAALRAVLARLSNLSRESTSVVAGDRMGRTSFLRYLTSAECRAAHPELAPFVPVFFDGQAASAQDSQAIWGRLLQLAQRACPDPSLNSDFERARQAAEAGRLSAFHLEDLFDRLAEKGLLLLVAVDDFHYLLSNRRLGPPDSFYSDLRSLLLRVPHTLVMVLASPRQLLDLWELGPGGSPFYNVFGTVFLGRFEEAEVGALLEEWLAQTGVHFTAEDAALIWKHARGHPMLTQFAASVIYNCYLQGMADRAAALDQAIRDPSGQAVMLQRHLLRALTPEERQMLEAMLNSPAALAPYQRNKLKSLNEMGLLPPGVIET